MRDNRKDRTIERNYTQKWCFLIAEYELVKADKRLKFRFAQDFYAFHGVNRQTFSKRGQSVTLPMQSVRIRGWAARRPSMPCNFCQRIT